MSGGPFRVVGLDLSLTSAGISDTHQSFPVRLPDDWPTEARIIEIMREVFEFTGLTSNGVQRADLVMIEGAAAGLQTRPGSEELSGLRIMARCMLHDHGVPFAVVNPSSLKKFTTGTGKATKAHMVRALRERHDLVLREKVSEGRDDMADAFALAAMGHAYLDRVHRRPTPFLPFHGSPAPLASLLAVDWSRYPSPA